MKTTKRWTAACAAAAMLFAAAVPALAKGSQAAERQPKAKLTIEGPQEASPGDKIEIVVSGEGEGIFGRVSVEGLKPCSSGSRFSDSLGEDLQADISGPRTVILLPDFGIPSASYTYEVTAIEGEKIRFSLSDVTESENDGVFQIPGAEWSLTVGSEQQGKAGQNAAKQSGMNTDMTGCLVVARSGMRSHYAAGNLEGSVADTNAIVLNRNGRHGVSG